MPADTTAPLRVRSAAAKPAQPSRSDASEQQTTSPMQVGKASGWKTKSKPHTDAATFSPSDAKDVADTAAAAAAAVGSSADALAMMPIIPAPADTLGSAPSGSKHEQQKTADDAVPQPAAAVPQKATAALQDKAAQPTQDVPDAPCNAYLIIYVAFLQRAACMLSRSLLCGPCL